jgi:hypothetical protein
MANFPNTPILNETYTDTTSGFTFQWDGTVWRSYTPQSLVLNVVARTETVAVPISVGSLVLDTEETTTTTTTQINDLDFALFD